MTATGEGFPPGDVTSVPTGARARRLVLAEILVLFVALAAGTHAVYRGALAFEWVRRHAGDLQMGLYFYLPLIPLLWYRLPLASFGLAASSLGRGVVWGLVTSVTVLPVFAVAGYSIYRLLGWPVSPTLPPSPWAVLGYHLAFVALPEELFFRGYVQSRLDEVLGRPWSVLGARVGPGLVGAAALFALLHPLLDDFWIPSTWYRLEVFFPALLFGWLRNRTDSLVAPVIFHALCNVTLFTLQG